MMPLSFSAHSSCLAGLCSMLALGACKPAPELRLVKDQQAMTEGKRLLEEGRAIEAVVAYRRELRQDSTDLQTLNGLAIAYSALGRHDLAAEMFGRALALDPKDAATLNNIGFAALRRADVSLARHYLERAQDQEGDLAEVEGNLSGLSLLEGMERDRTSKPKLEQAVYMPDDDTSNAVTRLSLQRSEAGGRSTNEPERNVPETSPQAMIDFTTLNDPFAKKQTAERTTME